MDRHTYAQESLGLLSEEQLWETPPAPNAKSGKSKPLQTEEEGAGEQLATWFSTSCSEASLFRTTWALPLGSTRFEST